MNAFLSEHQRIEDGLVPNSIFALVRDRNVSLIGIDSPGTEPPVADFESGFIGATDDDLWRTLWEYADADGKGGKATRIDREMIVVLDEISATNDTIKMLYEPQHEAKDAGAGRQTWRVDFLYVFGVVAYLPEDELNFMNPEQRDENGVIDMQEIHKAAGCAFPSTWRRIAKDEVLRT